MPVYVQNKHGQPLMPCSPAKARHLLKDKKAKVIQRTPFTIQLFYGSSGYKQPIILGIDAGSKTIGIAACTETEVIYTAEVKPRNDVVDLLSTRREFRRARRNRNTRYRQPRFDNRTHSKHKGWLASSVEVKIQEHITPAKRICIILPITKVIVETAEFDLQLIKAVEQGLPVPQGEDYQKGEMLGHYNVRQYVFFRDNYTCRCCGRKGKDVKLHTHHLESRKTGGNAPDNEITLCDDCHDKLHKGIIIASQLLKRKRHSTRDAAFMGIMRKTLMKRLRNELTIPVYETHGYATKYTRVELLKLPKSHINDAIAIASGKWGLNVGMYHYFQMLEQAYKIVPVRHHNRQLHKATILKGGIRKNNQAPKYVKGFRLWDKVQYNGIECFISGRRTRGCFMLKTLDGKVIHHSAYYKKLRLLERSVNYLIEKEAGALLAAEVVSACTMQL